MKDRTVFFSYVIPSILSFALSGVYAIVDGFFVGNTIGDAGLSAINIAYPIVALIQSIGTGIGLGAAVRYSINMAEKKEKNAKEYIAGAMWLFLILGIILTFIIYVSAENLLGILGAKEQLLTLGTEYIKIIAIGTMLQLLGTGLVPLMRNFDGALWAMIAMISGFITNIIFDYVLVWVYSLGITGAAIATLLGQGVTMIVALFYCILKKKITFHLQLQNISTVFKSIFKIGLAPFGLAMTPNISLIIINRFSALYGGEIAIATYACIAYIICIIYLILQGVGDGIQPLMSKFYGSGETNRLNYINILAYKFSILLALIGVVLLWLTKSKIGLLFGTSYEVNTEISNIMPIFLVSVPCVAITRIATSRFYATEKSIFSYILTFIEPILMLILMIILPPILGGQIMIWWSTVFARIITAIIAILLTAVNNKDYVSTNS
ncbi:MATE family efflux transporter [Clostridium sp. HCP1S3_B4]|uniref:MATE family efflux transporter n=1 Tax=unclassified Clostridium TaxID=2614128 RepID=UPI003F8A1642